jgi:hypothetical protein
MLDALVLLLLFLGAYTVGYLWGWLVGSKAVTGTPE